MQRTLLLDNYQQYIYYVYAHKEPRGGDPVYIGHGCKSRAWVMGTSTASVGKYGHRKVNHQAWLEDLTNKGYTPGDWTTILYKGLSKQEAGLREKELIVEFEPKFNYSNNPAYRAGAMKEKYDHCFGAIIDLRKAGKSYAEIGNKLGIGTMTIWRLLNAYRND